MQKTVLVTGSSGGIGGAIALRLARDGYYCLLHYHENETAAQKILDQILKQKRGDSNKNTLGGEGAKELGETTTQKPSDPTPQPRGQFGELVRFDVRESSSIEACLKDKSIHALVNNAGLHIDTLAGLMSDESFDQVMKTNAYGPFYLMRLCVRKMIRQRSGAIVNISSLSGQIGNPGQMNYSASKAALIAMTKTLASEVGSRGIRVNAVAPGLIETEMISETAGIEQLKSRIPLGRWGRADEVASAVSFLLSDEASYITGHTLSVNGGLYPT